MTEPDPEVDGEIDDDVVSEKESVGRVDQDGDELGVPKRDVVAETLDDLEDDPHAEYDGLFVSML